MDYSKMPLNRIYENGKGLVFRVDTRESGEEVFIFASHQKYTRTVMLPSDTEEILKKPRSAWIYVKPEDGGKTFKIGYNGRNFHPRELYNAVNAFVEAGVLAHIDYLDVQNVAGRVRKKKHFADNHRFYDPVTKRTIGTICYDGEHLLVGGLDKESPYEGCVFMGLLIELLSEIGQ